METLYICLDSLPEDVGNNIQLISMFIFTTSYSLNNNNSQLLSVSKLNISTHVLQSNTNSFRCTLTQFKWVRHKFFTFYYNQHEIVKYHVPGFHLLQIPIDVYIEYSAFVKNNNV